ncbi:thioredoxin reductase [Streptomyces sp. BK022]|uniref:NAD(P)/FAD-dependent oxidoreductase n=1 Tax=Streptomyces sp. BK022 TaxID=2512123 RepID=UPI001029B9C7|nr:NAD(P)/FAD-dependent oxidoreductase [Streptomyces sp. BK022]RZU34943.1 thioredoxin reductase [Streptomyces sp. BK022]
MQQTERLTPSTHYDVIIVGAGAAGLSAAVMTARSKRSVLVVSLPERRNSTATSVRNVPFAHGERPEVIYAKMEKDAAECGAQFVWDHVDGVSASESGVLVTTRTRGGFTARRLILATGREDRLPGWIPEGTWGKSIFECPYCHTFENDGKDFAVVGRGGNAVWMARLAQRHAGRMTVIVADSQAPEAEKRAAELLVKDGAEIVIDEIAEAEELPSGRLQLRTRESRELVVDVVLLTEVAQPERRFTGSLGLELLDNGYPRTDINGRTSHPLVYSAGNAIGTSYYMWTGAASSGLNAARAVWEDFAME